MIVNLPVHDLGEIVSERVRTDRKTIGRTKYAEFCYRTANVEPVSIFTPYWADTKDNQRSRYAHFVSLGGKDNPLPTIPKSKDNTDIFVRTRDIIYGVKSPRFMETNKELWEENIISIWLLANIYTMAKRHKMIEQFTIGHLPHCNEDGFIRSETERLIRGIML